jgi:hypothetical protein
MYHFNSTGVYPNLKNYGGVMRLLYTTPRNIIEKKIRKKNYFLCSKFFIYIFAYIKIFTYLCSRVGVASTSG